MLDSCGSTFLQEDLGFCACLGCGAYAKPRSMIDDMNRRERERTRKEKSFVGFICTTVVSSDSGLIQDC